MEALITGGAGFIGSHLADWLLDRGDSVSIVDDLSTGSRKNVEHLESNPNFRFEVDSVLNRPLMDGLIERSDIVFHLAAAVGVELIVDRPVHTIKTNIEATEVVLEIASATGKRVLLTSSSEVYGKSNAEKFSEEDDLILGPTSRSRWAYAASKVVDEFLALAFYKEHGLPTTVARLFNTIGPRQTGRYGMVVPRFVRSALLGEDILVYGDGFQRRSFTWVDDVVKALVALAEQKGAAGGVYNIGHTKDISIGELASLIRELADSDSEIRYIPYDEAYEKGFEDMRRRLPDIKKIHDLVGYQPSKDLPEMIDAIIAYERQHLGVPRG